MAATAYVKRIKSYDSIFTELYYKVFTSTYNVGFIVDSTGIEPVTFSLWDALPLSYESF